MVNIAQSVGERGINRDNDVRAVQTMLNHHIRPLGLMALKVDGNIGPRTIDAIRRYQKSVVGIAVPDGRIDPGGRTLSKLSGRPAHGAAAAPARPATAAAAGTAGLSGGAWWRANQARYPNSASVSDLDASFSGKVASFIKALRDAGANVQVSATRRNKTRAYLMHYCWKISRGAIKASAVPASPDCAIIWDHGNDGQSRAAAQEMVSLFAIAYQPSLTSHHISGLAIDMTITWSGTISVKNAQGTAVSIGAPRNDSNSVLHSVGATYGVIKLISDPPHWSFNGH
jgi:hypothetical protein